MSPSSAARPFSTTSHVYPSHLPTLYKSGRLEKKFATATAAVVGIGYGMAKYKEYQEQQQYHNAETEAASRRQSEAIMDAYADRSSLAELEAAVKAYETHRKG
ncbi:hypothetical protein GGR58DRAFT_498371 [Xylaria digitata]|uniref:Uncharacterized protein n=1 Tax=Xylaria multiplex TaxID=323545 RepID=A0A7C8MP52_9PEZI|nr:hypothetical protein GQX73_g5677 [Xylaria multiplex]KAI0541298.1 hypothetical protein GGR58DRAFT_498371 [Xylaria digitata]